MVVVKTLQPRPGQADLVLSTYKATPVTVLGEVPGAPGAGGDYGSGGGQSGAESGAGAKGQASAALSPGIHAIP